MRTNGPAAEVYAKSAAIQIIVLVSKMSIAGAKMRRFSIENYLPDAIAAQTLSSKCGCLGMFL